MKKIKNLCLAIFLCSTFSSYASCTLTLNNINFGNYNPFLTSDVLSSSQSSIICDTDSTFGLKFITGSSGTPMYRFMSNTTYGTETTKLRYELFTDVARTSIWGDNTGGSDYSGGNIKSNTIFNFNIYGTLYKLQNIYKGNYSESVQMEVSY